MNNPMLLDPTDLFTAQALTVSGGATPSLTSSPRLAVGKLSKLHVFVRNTGASTNCTISIYGAPTSTGTMTESLAVFTLGAGNVTPYSAGRYIERDAVPRYIYAVITNSDAANTATITVTLDRYR
jgi:hypothetical protein